MMVIGSWLRRRVVTACGSADRFAALGVAFGDWLRLGNRANKATVDRVEPYLAAYLSSAQRNGHRWGAMIGLVAGLALSLVLVVLVVGVEALT